MAQTTGDGGGGSAPKKRAKRVLATSSMPTSKQLAKIRMHNKKHPNNKIYWR